MKKTLLALTLALASALCFAQTTTALANTVQLLTQRQANGAKVITLLNAKLAAAQAALALSQSADNGAVLTVAQVDSISAVLENVPFTSAGQAASTTVKLQAVVAQITANIARVNAQLTSIATAITLLNGGGSITAAQLATIETLLN